MDITTIICVGALLLLSVYAAIVFNEIIRLKNQFLNGYAQIDVQLKRRHDLIPKLIDTAKAFMAYEQETLVKITEQRAKVMALNTQIKPSLEEVTKLQLMAKEEGILGLQLKSFIAHVENYPDLKSNQTMLQLMEELSTTENRIAFARQFYNGAVMSYNTYIQQVPNLWVAQLLNLPSATFLEFEESKT